MITTGSKLLVGSAGLAWVAAAVYGIAQEGILGTIGLISLAVALSLLAGINLFIGDSNVSAMDHESFESSAAAQATARPSLWPLLVGLGATTVTLGLATFPVIFVIGIVLIFAGTVEWLIQGWAERASADRRYNAEVRDLMIDPLELPVAGAILFAGIVYGFSRVMLGVPSKTSTVVVFSIVAIVLLAVGAFIATDRGVSKQLLGGVYGVGVLALILGGSVYGLNGEREIEEHETTADLAEEDQCTAEETHADENGSQTVSSKSNPSAIITFTGSDLEVDVPGFDGDLQLTLPRSNPHNILFRNDSDDHARLVLEMHPPVDDDGHPLATERYCTTLLEESGVQFLTVEFDRPSFALDAEGNAYEFLVPGSDATVEVVVP